MSAKYKCLDLDGMYFVSFAAVVTSSICLVSRCRAHKLQTCANMVKLDNKGFKIITET